MTYWTRNLLCRYCSLHPGNFRLGFSRNDKKRKTIEYPADLSYRDKETLDFELILDKNCYTNLKSLHMFPNKIQKII